MTNQDLEQWRGLVYNIVNRFRENTFRYKTQIDWDEITQVGMIALWRCINNYNESKGSFKNYAITAITRAILRQYIRFDKKIENHDSIEDYSDSYNFDDTEIDIEISKEKIKNIIKKLNIKEKSKEILLLRLEGNSLSEIAKEVGVTYQDVSNVIYNHKNKIRDRLYREV